jgi:hypothetical protein
MNSIAQTRAELSAHTFIFCYICLHLLVDKQADIPTKVCKQQIISVPK